MFDRDLNTFLIWYYSNLVPKILKSISGICRYQQKMTMAKKVSNSTIYKSAIYSKSFPNTLLYLMIIEHNNLKK